MMETETDENLRLDRALDKLDMLSTITDARREYLNEMRVRGVRAGPGNVCTSWRYQRSEPSNINGSSSSAFIPKEPFRQRSHSSSGLQNGFSELSTSNSGSNSHLNKLLHNRRSHHHSRISPYGYCSIGRRRPLNSLTYGSSTGSTSASTTSSGSTSSVSSANIEDNNGLMIASTVSSFTHFLKEHEKLQQKYLEQMKVRDVIQNTPMLAPPGVYVPASGVFQPNGCENQDEAKHFKAAASAAPTFVSASDDACPAPSLIRSKSLEDLRECIKPKPKSLSSYFCGNNSLDASSLSPRTNYCDLSAFHQTFRASNVEEARLIKKEIDSMSVRIGNLDVG